MSAPPAKKEVCCAEYLWYQESTLWVRRRVVVDGAKYRVGKSIISNITKQAWGILSYKERKVELGMKWSAKDIEVGNFEQGRKGSLYLVYSEVSWRHRAAGSAMLEGQQTHQVDLWRADDIFNTEIGWKDHFCQLHRIHMLTDHKEKLSADWPAATNIVGSFVCYRWTFNKGTNA